MKTYCKNISLTDCKTILPFVLGCFDGKWKRSDFQGLIAEYSERSKGEIKELIATDKTGELSGEIRRIAEDIGGRILARDLRLSPVFYSARVDGLSGKVREIGIETPFHQCCDHVAVGCLRELFEAKTEHYQCASIAGRGQIFGKNAIQRFIQKDIAAAEDARNNGRRYSRKAVYHVKVDVRKCYPSLQREMVMGLLGRDIHKNKTLLWFVDALLQMHTHGFIIGSLLSQFLCNYTLSYAYREIAGLHKERRGKQARLVHFQLFYMDDMLFAGSSRRDLKMAIRHLEKYMLERLGLTIKPGWHIKELAKEPIDMMGYVIHADGGVTIRAKIFIRARRTFQRAESQMDIDMARRVVSYRGYFINSNSKRIAEKLKVEKIARKAQKLISDHEKGGIRS